MPAGEHEAVASARQAVERRAHTVPVKFRSWTADAGSSIKRLNLLSGRSQRTHRTKEGSNLAPIGDRLCAVATVPEGIPIALGRPRRQAAVQPAAAVQHCRRPARAPAPGPRATSRAAVHGQSALHGVVPLIWRDPRPPGPRPHRPPLARRGGRGRARP
jgi:hypothetical protein